MKRQTIANYKLKEWMNMTSLQRNSIDIRDKRRTSQRKKLLIDKIRKEYKTVSNSKIKK